MIVRLRISQNLWWYDRWLAQKPTFSYGPADNITSMGIKPRAILFGKMVSTIRPIDPTTSAILAPIVPLFTRVEKHERIKCIGLGVYDFEDDRSLAN